MGPESLHSKIERLITEVLRARKSLPLKDRPMPEEDLVRLVVQKFGDGDISRTIAEVIAHMEHGKFTLIRDLSQNLEINER